VEIAIGMLKMYKSPCTDQIPTELIKAGGETVRSERDILIPSIWNKKELSQQWNESVIVPIHKKGDNTDCNYYGGIPPLSNILLARLTPYVNEIIGDHLYNILLEFGVPKKVIRLIKMFLNVT
jgi:hypothetical protein